MSDDSTHCPHCGEKLKKLRVPEGTSWGEVVWAICFNDECSYFKEGWEHMRQTYEANCSYRYRYDPETRAKGPMVVYSAEMGLDRIIPDQ